MDTQSYVACMVYSQFEKALKWVDKKWRKSTVSDVVKTRKNYVEESLTLKFDLEILMPGEIIYQVTISPIEIVLDFTQEHNSTQSK